jgi:crotonobetaine/carnitine-CoA ligase
MRSLELGPHPPSLPSSERTLPALLIRQADRFGDRTLVRTDVGSHTFADAPRVAAAVAGRLANAGIRPGDRVAVMSENRLELVDLWLGCAWLGAVLVPINTAARGPQLAHVLRDSAPRVLVIEFDLVPALAYVDVPSAIRQTWVLGGEGMSDAYPGPGEEVELRPARPGDPSVILYTSGTTGPSKGVVCPHAQWYWWASKTGWVLGVREHDVLYTSLPLFHTNALNTFVQALVHGATFVPGPRFSASAFFGRLAAAGATVTYLLGPMVQILLNRGGDDGERAHRVRVALAPATPASAHDPFRSRFGIELVDGWGSTETNCVIASSFGAAPPGSMGRVVPGFRARVVDEDDQDIRAGTPGELVVHSDEPFAFASGYVGLPEKTVEAWRNLWFHTGDRVVRDERDCFWFVDRISDAIRRRGENVSSFEVEAVLTSHPDVVTAAAFGVPSEVGEEDVAACVIVRDTATIDPVELIRFCEPRLAYFAIPRYLGFVDSLPLTPNGKVEKYKLRERGVTVEMWDREAHGITLRRR